MRQILAIAGGVLWALPYTMLGLLLGGIGLICGGRTRRRGRTVEFHGGFVTWLVGHLPTGPYTLAITLGHTILGQSEAALDLARLHELVHVRQFEFWGPFFGPAYLVASCYFWLIGGDPYHDNPFERQAYRCGQHGPSGSTYDSRP